MAQTRIRIMVVACLMVAASIAASGRASAQTATRVAGKWQTIVPASLTTYHPSATDPTTGTYTGVGSTVWRGSWTGVTKYAIQGTVNLVTAEGSGTIKETFVGRAADRGRGTLRLVETYTLDATGKLVIHCTIVGGSGAFVGSKGAVTFVGKELSVVTGGGTYRGVWTRPN